MHSYYIVIIITCEIICIIACCGVSVRNA